MNKYQKVISQIVKNNKFDREYYGISFKKDMRVWRENFKQIDNTLEFMRFTKNN